MGRGRRRRRRRRAYFTSKRIEVSTAWILGSSLPAQDGDAPIENNNSSHIVAGRFRVFANESLVNRFIAEMDLAAINGAASMDSIPQYYH